MDILPGSQLTASAVRQYVNESIRSLEHRGINRDATIDVLARNFILYFSTFYMSVRDNLDNPANEINYNTLEDKAKVVAADRRNQMHMMITSAAALIRISKLLQSRDATDIPAQFAFHQNSVCTHMGMLCPDMIEKIETNRLPTPEKLFELLKRGALPEVISTRLKQAKNKSIDMEVRVDYVVAALRRLMHRDFDYWLSTKKEVIDNSVQCNRGSDLRSAATLTTLVA